VRSAASRPQGGEYLAGDDLLTLLVRACGARARMPRRTVATFGPVALTAAASWSAPADV
jgi:hypothetical protein